MSYRYICTIPTYRWQQSRRYNPYSQLKWSQPWWKWPPTTSHNSVTTTPHEQLRAVMWSSLWIGSYWYLGRLPDPAGAYELVYIVTSDKWRHCDDHKRQRVITNRFICDHSRFDHKKWQNPKCDTVSDVGEPWRVVPMSQPSSVITKGAICNHTGVFCSPWMLSATKHEW